MQITTQKGRQAVLDAFDALGRAAICDPFGHAKGRGMMCAACRAPTGDRHETDCPIGDAFAAIYSIGLPEFAGREKWIAEGADQ